MSEEKPPNNETPHLDQDLDYNDIARAFSDKLRDLYRRYLNMNIGCLVLALALYYVDILRHRAPGAGYWRAISDWWATSGTEGDDVGAVAAAWMAIPVMIFVATSIERSRRSREKRGIDANRVLLGNIIRLVHLISGVGLWTLFPQALHSQYPVPNVLLVGGSALLSTAFFQLDAGNADLASADQLRYEGDLNHYVDALTSSREKAHTPRKFIVHKNPALPIVTTRPFIRCVID